METASKGGLTLPDINLDRLVSRQLVEACPRDAFTCGADLIDQWLKRKALSAHKRFKARVVTFHHEGEPRLLGFYALKLVLEEERSLRQTIDVRPWTSGRHFPAMQAAFMGVSINHQRKGLGTLMLTQAIDTFGDVAEKTGVPVLTLQPMNPALIGYYSDRGFQPYGLNGGMMMDARTAVAIRHDLRTA